MSLIAKKNGDYKPCPAGNHLARCVQLIDLGTHTDEYQGKKSTAPKIWISWELPNEKREFQEGEGLKPYVIGKEFTNSLGDRASLKVMLQAWRNKEFTPEELKGFDLRNILNAYCFLSVIHKKTQSGDIRARIDAVTSIPKGYFQNGAKPSSGTPIIQFSLDEFNKEVFDGLPDYLKQKIQASPEYNRLQSPNQDFSVNDDEPPLTDDDVPF